MKLVVRLPILILLLPIPTSSVATPSDLTGHKRETVFFLLGMLGEYSGRTFVEDSDLVERFYCNEHEVAFVFRAYFQRLAGEQALNRTIEEEWRQDFANSSKKRDLIRRLLEEMGCDSVLCPHPGEATHSVHGDTVMVALLRAVELAPLAGEERA